MRRYRLKNVKVQDLFLKNMSHGQLVRFFRKVKVPAGSGKSASRSKRAMLTGCKDMGLFRVEGFAEKDAFVRLVQADEL